MRLGPITGGRRRIEPTRRAILALCAVVPMILLARFPLAGAAFTAQTSNGNQASTLVIAPPTNVDADLALVVLPPSCRATVTWEPSATPGVTDYEVVLVSQLSGSVLGGPWVVSGTTHTDRRLPLSLLGSPWEWRVRSLYKGWHSEWRTGTGNEQIACLL